MTAACVPRWTSGLSGRASARSHGVAGPRPPTAVAVPGDAEAIRRVVAGRRPRVLVEDQPDELRGVEERQRLLDHPPRRAVRAHHEDHPVDELLQDPAVRHGNDGRRVDDDVVVPAPRLGEEVGDHGRLQDLVRGVRAPTRREDREVQAGEGPDDVLEAKLAVLHEIDHARGVVGEPQATEHRGAPKVGVDQQDPRVRRLSQRAGEIDRRRRLAVPVPRARDGHDAELGGLPEMLHQMPERPVLLGPEAGRIESADEMLVDLESLGSAFRAPGLHGRGPTTGRSGVAAGRGAPGRGYRRRGCRSDRRPGGPPA